MCNYWYSLLSIRLKIKQFDEVWIGCVRRVLSLLTALRNPAVNTGRPYLPWHTGRPITSPLHIPPAYSSFFFLFFLQQRLPFSHLLLFILQMFSPKHPCIVFLFQPAPLCSLFLFFAHFLTRFCIRFYWSTRASSLARLCNFYSSSTFLTIVSCSIFFFTLTILVFYLTSKICLPLQYIFYFIILLWSFEYSPLLISTRVSVFISILCFPSHSIILLSSPYSCWSCNLCSQLFISWLYHILGNYHVIDQDL